MQDDKEITHDFPDTGPTSRSIYNANALIPGSAHAA